MTTSVYFPSLNGLRAIAALVVVIHHTEQIKRVMNIGQPFQLVHYMMGSNDAVTFFFVLSGFLITYLLMVEMEQTGTLQVRRFYVRRILRIWPLYFLVVAVGFFVMPPLLAALGYPYLITDFDTRLAVYLLFLSNVVTWPGILPTLSHLWTIAIEEQFYLFWPPVLRWCKQRVLLLLVSIIVAKTAVSWLAIYTAVHAEVPQDIRHTLSLLSNFRIESMAIGGLGAYLLLRRTSLLKLLFHPLAEKATLLLMLVHFVALHGDESPYATTAFSFLYIAFILNLACNPASTLKLENRLWNALGKVSYGLYMYHLFVIYPALLILRDTPLWQQNPLLMNILTFSLVIFVNLALAAASYRWFEQPFRRLKARFSLLPSAAPANLRF